MYIGEISKKTDTPIKTIRYYEDLGLLQHPKRTVSKYRIYNQKDIEKLIFVKKAKDLGFTLAEIKRVIKRSSRGVEATCQLVHEIFENKITEYEQKIKALTATKHHLSARLHHWVNPKDAKNIKFCICPQIEKDSDTDECPVHGKRGRSK